ncbi:microtubule-associated protein 4-like isoform X1 [Arapaima gigas]
MLCLRQACHGQFSSGQNKKRNKQPEVHRTMADLDLNDALSESKPQSDPENVVQRDFVKTLEAETYNDQVGETVSKTNYVPLLDKDGEQQEGEPVLENGQQETQGPQTPGFAVTLGAQGALHSTEQQVPTAELLSGPFVTAGCPAHWGSHVKAPPMDAGLTGLSWPGPEASMHIGGATLPAERPPAVADEPQKQPLLAEEPQHACTLKRNSFTEDISHAADPSSGVWSNPWGVEAGLQANLPFTPSVSTVISRHASQIAEGSREPPDGHWQRTSVVAVCEEKELEGSDQRQQQQKKKKKRRPRDNAYNFLESQVPSDFQETRGENRTPRRDGGWEREEGGRSGARMKKSKGRRKMPEEWNLLPDTLATDLAIYSQGTEALNPSLQKPLLCPVETSSFPLDLEEDLTSGMPLSLVDDLLSLTVAAPSFPSSSPAATSLSVTPRQGNDVIKPVATSLENFLPSEQDFDVAPLKACDKMDVTKGYIPLLSDLLTADTCGSKEVAPHTPDSNVTFHKGSERALSMQSDPVTDSLKMETPKETPIADVNDPQPTSHPAKAAPTVFSDLTEGCTPTCSEQAPCVPSELTVPPEDAPGHDKPLSLTNDSTLGPNLLEVNTSPTLSPVSPPGDAPLFCPTQHKQPPSPPETQSKKSQPAKGLSSPGSQQLLPETPPNISPTQPLTGASIGLNSTLNPAAPPFFPISPVATPDGGKEGKGCVTFTEQEVKAEKADNQEKIEKSGTYQKTNELAASEKKAGGETMEKNEKHGKTEQKIVEKIENLDVLGKTDKDRQHVEKTEKLENAGTVETVRKMESEKVEKVDETDKKTDVKPEKVDTAEKAEKMEKTDVKPENVNTAEKTDGKTEKVDKPEEAEKMEKTDVKTEKVDTAEKTDGKTEKVDRVENADSKVEKASKADKLDMKVEEAGSKAEKTDKINEIDNKIEKRESVAEKVAKVERPDMLDKVNEVEKTGSKVEKTEKVDNKVNKDKKDDGSMAEELDKVDKVNKVAITENLESTDKLHEKMVEMGKSDKAETTDIVVKKDNVEKTDMTEKADKNEKPPKVEKKEKPGKAEAPGRKNTSSKMQDKGGKAASKPTPMNGISAAPKKDVTSPEKSTKPSAGSAKPSPAKPRANGLSAGTTTPKRPSPSLSSSSATASKKSPMPKATTLTAGTKRPSSTASRPPSTATAAASHEEKPKEGRTGEKRPPAVAQAQSPKNHPSTVATEKPAGAPRAPLSTRTSASTPTARRSTLTKTESEAGEVKKRSTSKAMPAEASLPKSTTSQSSATPSIPGSNTAARTRTSKPATPTPAVPERKPPVPRAPRSSAAVTKASPRPRSSPSPNPTPAPDIRNARSKIGSTDNMKYQPGGGKVSTSQGRSDPLAKGETSQAKVQIVNKKLDFSHVTSRLGSKDNIKHVPGGGNVQILNKKVDLSKVTSKCGSKTNIKHKPGGGDVKTESRKGSTKEKAQSKVEAADSVSPETDGGHIKAEAAEAPKEDAAPSSGVPVAVPAESTAQENGVKEGAPCGSGTGLWDSRGLDSHIPETSKCTPNCCCATSQS